MTPMEKVDLLRAACCVAGIDGQLGEHERAILDRLAGDVGVGLASLEAMIDRGKRDPEFHKEQFRVLKVDPQQSMATLLQVALADGQISTGETSVLKALSEKLDVPDEVFDQLIQKAQEMGGSNG